MPLEPCYECNKEISTLARSCPNCGAPNKNTKKKTSSIPTTSEWTAEDDKKLLSLYKKKVPEFTEVPLTNQEYFSLSPLTFTK